VDFHRLITAILGGFKKQPQSQPAGVEGLGGLLGGLLSSQNAGSAMQGAAESGFASMLDLNGDGNALDHIMRMAGKVMR
jgi:hypothetical protein